jgi:hypothetical protein
MVRDGGDQRVRNLLGRPRPVPAVTENGTVTAEQYLGALCCLPPPRPDSWQFAATRLR